MLIEEARIGMPVVVRSAPSNNPYFAGIIMEVRVNTVLVSYGSNEIIETDIGNLQIHKRK